jgi:hypothetical protein
MLAGCGGLLPYDKGQAALDDIEQTINLFLCSLCALRPKIIKLAFVNFPK